MLVQPTASAQSAVALNKALGQLTIEILAGNDNLDPRLFVHLESPGDQHLRDRSEGVGVVCTQASTQWRERRRGIPQGRGQRKLLSVGLRTDLPLRR